MSEQVDFNEAIIAARRSVIGGIPYPKDCPPLNFTNVLEMVRKGIKPPPIALGRCPDRFLGKKGPNGEFVPFYDDPPPNCLFGDIGNRNHGKILTDLERREAEWDYSINTRTTPTIKKEEAKHLVYDVKAFGKYNDSYACSKFMDPPTNMEDMHKEYKPLLIRQMDVEDEKRESYPHPQPKVVIYRDMPKVKVDPRLPKNHVRLHDTEEYKKRAQFRYYENQLLLRRLSMRELLALQAERDRSIFELNILDPSREWQRALALREHIDELELEIDASNLVYGIMPQQTREPDALELAISKVRGAAFYVGDKIKKGVKKIVKKVKKSMPTIAAAASLVVPAIGVVANLINLKRKWFG